MSHPFDALLMFLTGSDVTASVSLGPVTVWGLQTKGSSVRVVVEDAFGANDTMLVNVYTSEDNSTYNLVAKNVDGAVKVDGGYEFLVPFALKAGKNYVKVELVVTAASTTSLFEDVYAGIIGNVGTEFDRSAHWE